MKTRVCLLVAVLAGACTFGVSAAGADSFQFSGPMPVDAIANAVPLGAVACVSGTQCTAVDNSTLLPIAHEMTFDPGTVTPNGPAVIGIDNGGRTALSVSCPDAGQCTAVDDYGYEVTFNPATGAAVAGGVSGPQSIDSTQQINGVSCPSSQQCTAVDRRGYEVTFDPATGAAVAGGASGPQDVDSSLILTGVSCFSTALCAAVDSSGNAVTFDPSSDPVTATVTGIGGGIAAVSCPSADQCTAVADVEELTFNPNTGTSGLRGANVDAHGNMSSVSCPSVDQCTAVDAEGEAVTFDPATSTPSGQGAVVVDDNSSDGDMTGVSCPSTGQCTAVDRAGYEVTFNPRTATYNGPAATPIDRNTGVLTSTSCPSSGQCTVVDRTGHEATFDPATGAAVPGGVSGAQAIDGYDYVTAVMNSVSCPSTGQCTAVDGLGDEVTFNPATGSAVYPLMRGPQFVDDQQIDLASVACPSVSQCTAVDGNGRVMTFDPADALSPSGAAVVPVSIDSTFPEGIACPSVDQCTVLDNTGDEVTFDPATVTANGPAVTNIDSAVLSGLSCPSTTQCTAVDRLGDEVTFTPATGAPVPGGPNGPQSIDTHFLTGVSCPLTGQCTATDLSGYELTFNPRAPGTPAPVSVDPFSLSSVSCFSASECVFTANANAYLGEVPASTGPGGTNGGGNNGGGNNGAGTNGDGSNGGGGAPTGTTPVSTTAGAPTTTQSGRLDLTTRTAKLTGHTAAVSVRCASPKACSVRLTLTTRARVRSGGRLQTVTCATASAHIAAGRTGKVATRIKATCVALLRRARGHTIATEVRAMASTGQTGLTQKLTLRR
jgi:hypothetical protein